MPSVPTKQALTPLIKWPGGKRSELPVLKPHFPSAIQRVIEPFAGGAAVAWDVNAPTSVLNDVNSGLVEFHKTLQNLKTRQDFFHCVEQADLLRKNIKADVQNWSAKQVRDFFKNPEPIIKKLSSRWMNNVQMPLSLSEEVYVRQWIKQAKSKTQTRIPALEIKHNKVFSIQEKKDHAETSLQTGSYNVWRDVFNGKIKAGPAWDRAGWWLVRCLCYSGMFRFGPGGDFNVPYGGISYNSRDFSPSIKSIKTPKVIDFLKRAQFNQKDFEIFLNDLQFQKDDFLFVDPPYDTAFSQYNKEGDFTHLDQKRLAQTLLNIQTPWMLVIKNTDFIRSLYQDPSLYRSVFDKSYGANFRNRHARDVEHLVVTNYALVYDMTTPGLRPLL
jgi:DNA adenine methylase